MMPINLMSIVAAKKDLSKDVFIDYLNEYDMNIRIRDHEYDDLQKLIHSIATLTPKTYIWNDFYVSYTIKQISKEFDVLKATEDAVVNIELKYDASESRIKKQLKQNEYYLKFLNLPMYFFTYVSKTNTLYKWENDALTICEKDELLLVLTQLAQKPALSLDELFDPAFYLVSPLETPEKFMRDEYFLTAQQTTYKKEIMDEPNHRYTLLSGGAGTGKTLLAYDLAKSWMQMGKHVIIVQSDPLSEAQQQLNDAKPWTICTINELSTLSVCDVLVIDEVHVVKQDEKALIQEFMTCHNPIVVMTADLTVIHQDELAFLANFPNYKVFDLKIVYRANESIVHYLMNLFDQNLSKRVSNKDLIEVHYFSTMEDAYTFIQSIQADFKIVNSAVVDEKSYYRQNDLLGKTLDNVAVLLDERFFYKKTRLVIKGDHMSEGIQRLYQILMKTRKRLKLIVVKNEPLLIEILKIKAHF